MAAIITLVAAVAVSAHEPAAHQPTAPAVPLDEDCVALAASDHRHDQEDPVMQALMQRCAAHEGHAESANEPPSALDHDAHDAHGGH
jgi:hypothetical protein